MKELLQKLHSGISLSHEEAEELMNHIIHQTATETQIVAAITTLSIRPISVNEIQGFRKVLMEMATKPNLSPKNAIDVCGTGGDGKNTFNISTTAALVIAAAGYKVIKHGNYGMSSNCGSSTVLEQLGYRFSPDSDKLQQELDECNICFLHAPLFHPALKAVANIRRSLGVSTFFNFLGPLLNPVQPEYQLTGVFNQKLVRVYQEILSKERANYKVIHGLDGYDEVSLTSGFLLSTNGYSQQISPSDLGLENLSQEALAGGETVEESAEILVNILKGTGTRAQTSAVLANAALGIQCFTPEKSFTDAYEEAHEALINNGYKNLEKLLSLAYETVE
ncbi:MAG: anthranilate phosphoribosyltransferase [Crocinitomicaceae bacterium]|nr:anthranilate phosphoribosyltransferase [Crocinitomicaceae bacterium]